MVDYSDDYFISSIEQEVQSLFYLLLNWESVILDLECLLHDEIWNLTLAFNLKLNIYILYFLVCLLWLRVSILDSF